MERLTFDGLFCDIAKCKETPGGTFCEKGSCSQRKVWERLKAYEDTGLEPEEIKELCTDEVAEVARTFRRMIQSGEIAHLQELLNAEQDGRLVVLPCEVGDTVYMPTGRWGMTTGFESDVCDGFHIARDGVLQVKAKNNTGNHGTYGVPGKTVFLTREEAERALEGGKNNADT